MYNEGEESGLGLLAMTMLGAVAAALLLLDVRKQRFTT